ncbi:hypothetical protein CLAFUR0_08698 [Fulvia fulva]|nr:hypothetical protein CLAFUR0_08698 [Fulvia fulva]
MDRAELKEEAVYLLEESIVSPEKVRRIGRTLKARIWSAGWYIVMLVASNITSLSVAVGYARTMYSPDLPSYDAYRGQIDRGLTVRRFDRFWFTPNDFTRPPSKEVDQAWSDLGIWIPYFILPESLGPAHGLNNSHLKYSGDDFDTPGYPVVPEMIHHLHCLDSLRKNLYYNHEYYAEQRLRAGKSIAEEFMKAHINHCISALKERLLCTADIGIVPFLWRTAEGDVMPDFGREHKCYDHKSVIAWYEKHGVPENQSDIVVIPPPEAILHPADEFFEVD